MEPTQEIGLPLIMSTFFYFMYNLVFRTFSTFKGIDHLTDAKLSDVLTFIINQFTLINNEEMKEKAWYLIDHCKQVKLFHSVFSIEGKS